MCIGINMFGHLSNGCQWWVVHILQRAPDFNTKWSFSPTKFATCHVAIYQDPLVSYVETTLRHMLRWNRTASTLLTSHHLRVSQWQSENVYSNMGPELTFRSYGSCRPQWVRLGWWWKGRGFGEFWGLHTHWKVESLSLFLSFKFPKEGIFACVERKCPLDSFPFLVYES
jgi:hypothetical protein